MIIDTHQHFWMYDPGRDTWITPKMEMLRRDFLPHDIIQEVQAMGIDGVIAIQADMSMKENDFLLSLSENPFIAGVVGWFNFVDPDLEKSLEKYCAHPKLKGARHIIQDEKDGFMTSDNFVTGLATLCRYGLTFDLLIRENQLEEAEQLIRLLPSMPIVIDHIAKPDIKSESFNHWAKWMKKLSAYDQVCVKISGLATEANWVSWQKEDFLPYIDRLLELFGPARLMLGSDWPVCLLAGSYTRIVSSLTACLEKLSHDEINSIRGENAMKFYKI